MAAQDKLGRGGWQMAAALAVICWVVMVIACGSGGATSKAERKQDGQKTDATPTPPAMSKPIELKTKKQLTDFVDNTKNYKEKVLTVRLTYLTQDPLRKVIDPSGPTARCPFEIAYPGPHSRIQIDISPGFTIAEYKKPEDVPNAMGGEELMVTFLCHAGSLETENRAIRIVRAK